MWRCDPPLRRPIAAVLLFVIGVYLWISAMVPMHVIAGARYDDALYIRTAASIASGLWLGPYDDVTLSKGPMYPIWIALNWFIGIPIFLGQALLYALAGLLLLAAFAPYVRRQGWLAAAFVVYLFNPMVFDLQHLRVIRDSFYASLTVLITALLAWLFHLRGSPLAVRRKLSAALGIALGVFWLTREEGLWIAPTLLLAYALLLWMRRREVSSLKQAAAAEAPCAACALGAAAGGVLLAALINFGYYGVIQTAELKQADYQSAYGALARIDQGIQKPYVVMTRRALDEAAAASPRLRQIRPFFNPAWSEESCQYMGVEPCDGEFRSPHFFLALRGAAARAGYHRSAAAAAHFYARLTAEINEACERGPLKCSPPRDGMLPPVRMEDLARSLRVFLRLLRELTAFERLDIRMERGSGGLFDADHFESMTHTRAMPLAETLEMKGSIALKTPRNARAAILSSDGRAVDTRILQELKISTTTGMSLLSFDLRTDCRSPDCVLVVGNEGGEIGRVPVNELASRGIAAFPKAVIAVQGVRDGEVGPTSPTARRLKTVFASLRVLGAVYQALAPWTAAAALVCYLFSLALSLRRGRPSIFALINTVLLSLIASRLLMLAYLEVVIYPRIISPPYMTPAYPLFLLFCALALLEIPSFREKAEML